MGISNQPSSKGASVIGGASWIALNNRPIAHVGVIGLKSHSDWNRIELRPLTLLAGSNSTGKSSIVQALLLLKQTVESPFDPGALRISGPNVQFSAFEQLLSRAKDSPSANPGEVGIELSDGVATLRWYFAKRSEEIVLDRLEGVSATGSTYALRETSTVSDINQYFFGERSDKSNLSPAIKVSRNRCDLQLSLQTANEFPLPLFAAPQKLLSIAGQVVHVPGLRGNPQRTYPVTQVGAEFPGEFQYYTASLIAHWIKTSSTKLNILRDQLENLGLTSAISVERRNDTDVEVKVGRVLRQSDSSDLVSIADVGFGVSQVLPVLVGLLAADRGQIVYLEQPEIHLHPRAQALLADSLIDAARREVIVVAETHSSILLRAIQTRIARGDLPSDQTRLHWFTRDALTGETKVDSTQLDERGRYGDWPEDFSDVEMEVDDQYLSATSKAKG